MFDTTSAKQLTIPVVDLFAGPGGLGEGFASLKSESGQPAFEIVASAEKEEGAWHTLLVRTLRRHCQGDSVASSIFENMMDELVAAGQTSKPLTNQKKILDAFSAKLPVPFAKAYSELLGAPLELGKAESDRRLEKKLSELRLKDRPWILVGGPPCQAFSLVGRSRNAGNANYDPFADERINLYQEYLKVLRKFGPSVFVMENVKGLASAKLGGQLVAARIFHDLTTSFMFQGRKVGYRLYSLTTGELMPVDDPDSASELCRGFVVNAEDYGIPQTRHRVIIVGLRSDLNFDKIPQLEKSTPMTTQDAIGDLPNLYAGVSSRKAWHSTDRVHHIVKAADDITKRLSEIQNAAPADFNILKFEKVVKSAAGSILKHHSSGAHGTMPLNHSPRTHMPDDLCRYFFCACWAAAYGSSPKSENFPEFLFPNHLNFSSGAFADRFRVQIAPQQAKTITSHIGKDGHYYIHPDPVQCRSLTVREAARLQTFSDDHFFMSSRTSQYQQVGNAVPPQLARQIAQSVFKIMTKNSVPLAALVGP